MADISKTSEQSLNNILDKLGVRTQEDVKKEGNKNTLGQEDFLKLMTTQLQNQDPFAPMDNGDFIAQMRCSYHQWFFCTSFFFLLCFC